MANGWSPERRGAPSQADPPVATVGEINRAENSGRQRSGVPQRVQGRHLAVAARAVGCPTEAEETTGRVTLRGLEV